MATPNTTTDSPLFTSSPTTPFPPTTSSSTDGDHELVTTPNDGNMTTPNAAGDESTAHTPSLNDASTNLDVLQAEFIETDGGASASGILPSLAAVASLFTPSTHTQPLDTPATNPTMGVDRSSSTTSSTDDAVILLPPESPLSLMAMLEEDEKLTPFGSSAAYTPEFHASMELDPQQLFPTYVPDMESDDEAAARGPSASGGRARCRHWADRRSNEGEPEVFRRFPLLQRPSRLSRSCRFGSDISVSDEEETDVVKHKRKLKSETAISIPGLPNPSPRLSRPPKDTRLVSVLMPLFDRDSHMKNPKARTMDERNAPAADLYIFETNVFAVTIFPQHGLHEDYRKDGGDKIELLAQELGAAFIKMRLLTHVESSFPWEATILVKWYSAKDIERITRCLNHLPLPSLRLSFRSSEVEALEHHTLMVLFDTLDLQATMRLQVACTYADTIHDIVWESFTKYLTSSRCRTVRHLAVPPFNKPWEHLPFVISEFLLALWFGNATLESLCFHGNPWCGDIMVTSDWWASERCSGCRGDQGDEDARKPWSGLVDVGIKNRLLRVVGVEDNVLRARWLGQVLLRKVHLASPHRWAPASVGRRLLTMGQRGREPVSGGRPAGRRVTFLDLPYEVRSRIVEMAADPQGHVFTPALQRAIDGAVTDPRVPPRVRLYQWAAPGWSFPMQYWWPDYDFKLLHDRRAMSNWLDSQGFRWYGTVAEGIELLRQIPRPTPWQRLARKVRHGWHNMVPE